MVGLASNIESCLSSGLVVLSCKTQPDVKHVEKNRFNGALESAVYTVAHHYNYQAFSFKLRLTCGGRLSSKAVNASSPALLSRCMPNIGLLTPAGSLAVSPSVDAAAVNGLCRSGVSTTA